jgi:hypothetical protein
MILDDLSGLLQASRYLPRGEPVEIEAVRTLPELTDGLPPVVSDARGPRVWSGCAEAVQALCAGLASELLLAAASEPREDLEAELAGDPLVVGLARLVAEGAAVSSGAAVIPILEFIRAVHEVQTTTPLGAALEQVEAARRVGVAVQGRIALALALASQHARVPALAWALSGNRLLPVFPRGTLDRDPSWAKVAEILGIPLPPGTMEAVEAGARLAVKGFAARRAAGHPSAVDAILSPSLPPSRLDAGVDAAVQALLLDPEAVRSLLPCLPQLTDPRDLVTAGVSKERSARLLTPEGALAAMSVHTEVIQALRVWDILTQLCAAVGPAPSRGLAAPRAAPLRATVVAVGLGRMRADGGGEAAWRELSVGRDVGVFEDMQWVGVGVFPDAVDALRFALLVHSRIPTIALAISTGNVLGGTDGRVVKVWGAAVEAAVRWLPGPGRAPDLGVGRLRHVGGWVTGPGVTVDALATDAIQEGRVRRGLSTGADRPPGGDLRVPRGIDVYRTFELDGDVMVLMRIPGVAGGFELLRLTPTEWRAILDKDGASAGSFISARPEDEADVAGITTPLAADVEESAGWELADGEEGSEEVPITLDMGDGAEGPVTTATTSAGFEFDEEQDAPLADQGLFSGYYLPGAGDSAEEPAVAAVPQVAPAFAIQVEDDDETEEWGAKGIEQDQAAKLVDPFLDLRPAVGTTMDLDDPFGADEPVHDPPSFDPFADVPPPAGPGEVSAFVMADTPAASAEEVSDSASLASGRRRALATLDFDFLLRGYACFVLRGEAVFGRPYGTRVVDRHVYAYSGDLDAAYMAFLKDKIAEGFVPRSELMGDLPRGVTVMPLDGEKLTRAWQEIS